MPLPVDVKRRNFFGVGEILGVLANPSETLRSLTESKRMLEETRRELAEARERAQLSPTHTFSSLPGFFDRPAELRAIERALEGEPSFTVLFGASSVGKTALLRQVLTRSTYHVLHFDLRIAGFADLPSLYMSLSQQMEAFFTALSHDPDLPGYGEFEKEAWAFKHDRLNVERRVSNQPGESTAHLTMAEIKTSDIARLMELFQSSLLRYWNFQPDMEAVCAAERKTNSDSSSAEVNARRQSQPSSMNGDARHEAKEKDKVRAPPTKKIPVFFIDEAHKLPALIHSVDAMKSLLDAMLVLTKQDRLCHVIHATSDPFYQTWLRQLNVMQHCKIITIGDYPKADTRRFFRERILPSVPEGLRPKLDFEQLYEAFGGKLAHWQDFITDYVNSNGKLEIKQSSHFLQAHALLNLHIIHSAQAPPQSSGPAPAADATPPSERAQDVSQTAQQRVPPSPGSNSGFRIYSPLNRQPHAAPTSFAPTVVDGSDAPEFRADFTAIQLLKVMNRLAQPGVRSLPYFLLCRELGVRAVDGMVRGRILDLRWTDPITKEGIDSRTLSMRLRDSTRMRDSVRVQGRESRVQFAAGSSATAVNDYMDMNTEEGEMVPMTEDEIFRAHEQMMDQQPPDEFEEEIVGPKLVPITPIMRYAMREVVQEYYDDDDQTTSEYASLSEVQEY
ncbi:hypothetical protein DAEQUDRAFT_680297 [Daedalea quercina L-15889]|uniref:AAA+ ATPase domain-containing protein n=1 Tax=Daedalea quercina L-15889 TaxID=1314783 RepID=A0A165KRR7_9APHY|nr:hypothetical protein DAEQUDRAFT_680297 [Daedalea quercina L-15889]